MRHLLNPTGTPIILTCFGIFLNPSRQIQGEYLKWCQVVSCLIPSTSLHSERRELYKVYQKPWANFRSVLPTSKQGKISTKIDVLKTVVLEVQPPRSPALGHLDIYLWGRYIQFKLEAKRQLTNAILRSVIPFAIAPGPVKECDSPCVRWTMWGTFWAFAVNCDWVKTKEWRVVKLVTCAVTVCGGLSEHLLWTVTG